jgi:hypothetical protein
MQGEVERYTTDVRQSLILAGSEGREEREKETRRGL